MKTQQVTAILLCALLGSTLGHEFLRAKRFAPEPRSSRLATFEERALARPAEECTVICEPDDDQGHLQLQLIYNETTQLVGIVNVTAKVALIIDINANLVGVFDGSSGAIFILDLKAQTGVYIAGGLTNIGWISSQSTFEIFFSKLTTLQVFINLKIGKTFTFSGISKDVLKIFTLLLVKLSISFQKEIESNNNASLTILVKLSVSISSLLKGSLKGFLNGAGNGLIKLHGDIIWLGAVLEGLGALFTSVSGGLAALIAANIRFNLTLIFSATNGLELFINILFAIAARGRILLLASILSSTEKTLAIIVQLGGNVSTGVTGLFKVIYHIYVLIRGEIKLDVFLQVLLEFCASRVSKESINLDIYIEALTKLVEISGASSSSELSVFVTFVRNLKAGKLVQGNVNISAIIVILIGGSVTNALQLAISVLLKLTVVVGFGIVVIIPSLFFYLLLQLRSVSGITLLYHLGIHIDVTISGGVVQGLTSGINIQSVSGAIFGGDIESLVKVFPPFAKIYESVSGALQVSSKGAYSLKTVLKSSSVSQDIGVFVKGLVGLAPTSKPVTTTTSSHSGGIWTVIGSILGGGSGNSSGGGSGSGSGGGSGSSSGGGSGSSSGGGSGSSSGGGSGSSSGGGSGSISVGGSGSSSGGGSGSSSGGGSGSSSGGGSGSSSGGGSGSSSGGGSGSSSGGGSGSSSGGGSGSSSGGGSGNSSGGGSGSGHGSGSIGISVGGGNSQSHGWHWGWGH